MRDATYAPTGAHPVMVARPAPPPLQDVASYCLPWAQEHHADAYDKTLAVMHSESVARAYCARLIELMWLAFTPEQRRAMPIAVLQVSRIRATVARYGETFEVCGQYAPGPHRWEFYELHALDATAFEALAVMKVELDLYHFPTNG